MHFDIQSPARGAPWLDRWVKVDGVKIGAAELRDHHHIETETAGQWVFAMYDKSFTCVAITKSLMFEQIEAHIKSKAP